MKNGAIHNKLNKLQFETPFEDCRFLIIKIPYVGYGGQLSLRILGMKFAYIFNRTVIFDDSENPYLNCYEPISIFKIDDLKDLKPVKLELYKIQLEQAVYLDFDEYWLNIKNRNYFNNLVPKELSNQNIDKDYLNGQLTLRFKLLPKYLENINNVKNKIHFSKPIIGIHIRRGDKKNESAYVPIRIYNYYLKKAVNESGIKKVFVTSDSEDVILELPQNLGLEYIYDREEKRYNNANHELLTTKPELKEQETLTAIKIIELLSECNYLIGQINTHFTTIAYDLNLVKNSKKVKIYFVNRNMNDVYINNDPNLLRLLLDSLRKYTHNSLLFIVRKLKPILFKNEAIYRKIKEIYYGEVR
jgi:CMP-N-acetylneuraminic acid synthetase